MRHLVLVLALAFGVVALAQAQNGKVDGDGGPTNKIQPDSQVTAKGTIASVPVLSTDDKVAILQAQKSLLQVANQMQQLQNQYQTLTAQQNQLAKTMNDLVSKAEHEHPGFKLSLDSLEFTAPPEPAKKEEKK